MLPFKAVRLVSTSSARFFSLSSAWGGASAKDKIADSVESPDDSERRIFGDVSENDSKDSSFYKTLDKAERLAKNQGNSQFIDDLNENYDTLNDGLDRKLKKVATSFWYDEMAEEGYKYRPDVTFYPETTYDINDLDLTKKAVQKYPPRKGFVTSTEEVLRKADFRNVRFLANFITEAGIISKRKKTGISAKAQRKVAREIKTARAFGLMPFICMGTKPFVYGKSMKPDDLTLQFNDNYRGRLDDAGYAINKEDPGSL